MAIVVRVKGVPHETLEALLRRCPSPVRPTRLATEPLDGFFYAEIDGLATVGAFIEGLGQFTAITFDVVDRLPEELIAPVSDLTDLLAGRKPGSRGGPTRRS